MILWLASYPRSGNTALRIMLKNVFGLSTHSIYDDPLDIAVNPGVREAVGHIGHGLEPDAFVAKAAASEETFLIKTHGPPPDSSKAIYVVRDGRSASVSFAHWLNRYVPGAQVSPHDVIVGSVDHGSWSAHVEAWNPLSRPDTLFLKYLDVINPTPQTVSAVSDFMGVAPLEGGAMPTFRDLNDREPSFFRAGSDEKNIAELQGEDLELFWWLHGAMMLDLGFVEQLPFPSAPAVARTCFFDETARLRTLLQLKDKALLASKADIENLKQQLAAQAEQLAMLENALAVTSKDAAVLHQRLIDLTGSNWLRLGHELKLTRALRQVRSDLGRLSGASSVPALLPTTASLRAAPAALPLGDPPEVVAFHAASTARALERIARRGLEIGTVIDVGASNGMWSAVTEAILPKAKYLLIEAQEYHREALETYCRAHAGASFVLAAAGDQNGEVFFDDRSPFGGVASKEETSYAYRPVPMYSIDHLVASRSLPGPFLVKLDTHGFEVPILNGAVETLKSANLVVIEVYNFRILDNSLLFYEMCAFMRERGFGVIDVSEPLWRARDGAFWQMDLFFVPLGRPEFDSHSYE